MENTTSKFFSISHKEVKQLIESGEFSAIGSNLYQVNNQGEYTINEDGNKIYKRRNNATRAHFDLIATK